MYSRFLITAILLYSNATVFGSELGRIRDADGLVEYIVSTKQAEQKAEVNKMLTLNIAAKALKDGLAMDKVVLAKFDARMPAHNHGMVVKPKIKVDQAATSSRPPLVDGKSWVVEGVKLHMPGQWEIHLVVKRGDVKENLKFAMKL